jgi:TPR repeat protein
MRICNRVAFVVAAGFAWAAASTAVLALDDAKPQGEASAPLPMFKNPQQALNKYLEGYRAGKTHSSLEALRYAADGGEALARWKLGNMYQEGDGVPHDDYQAYKYFLQIVESYDESDPNIRERGVVAAAFVAIGAYSLSGIANTNVQRNAARALDMFTYAATEFGDPHAQYNLGRMYLDGDGVPQDARRGARWLRLAADKNHMESQALLGNLYFNGQGGVQRQRALGLMYLTLAREAAGDRKSTKWISDLYDGAMKQASSTDRQAALAYLENYMNGRH